MEPQLHIGQWLIRLRSNVTCLILGSGLNFEVGRVDTFVLGDNDNEQCGEREGAYSQASNSLHLVGFSG